MGGSSRGAGAVGAAGEAGAQGGGQGRLQEGTEVLDLQYLECEFMPSNGAYLPT